MYAYPISAPVPGGRSSSLGKNKSSGQELSLNGSQFGGCSTTYNTPANT